MTSCYRASSLSLQDKSEPVNYVRFMVVATLSKVNSLSGERVNGSGLQFYSSFRRFSFFIPVESERIWTPGGLFLQRFVGYDRALVSSFVRVRQT